MTNDTALPAPESSAPVGERNRGASETIADLRAEHRRQTERRRDLLRAVAHLVGEAERLDREGRAI